MSHLAVATRSPRKFKVPFLFGNGQLVSVNGVAGRIAVRSRRSWVTMYRLDGLLSKKWFAEGEIDGSQEGAPDQLPRMSRAK